MLIFLEKSNPFKQQQQQQQTLVWIQTQQIPYFLLFLTLISHIEKAELTTNETLTFKCNSKKPRPKDESYTDFVNKLHSC